MRCAASSARSTRRAALKALMEGSALRASHIDCDRVQDPYSLRCQPQVMGAALDQLRHAANIIERECNAVSDNPLVFADQGDIVSGGNFHAEPVAHGRRRHRHRDRRDRRDLGTAHRLADRCADEQPAGVPVARSRPQFRLHDRARDGGGARQREQAAGPSRQRRFAADLRQPGGPRLDGDPWRAPPARHGGQYRRHRRHRVAGGGAGHRAAQAGHDQPEACSRS